MISLRKGILQTTSLSHRINFFRIFKWNLMVVLQMGVSPAGRRNGMGGIRNEELASWHAIPFDSRIQVSFLKRGSAIHPAYRFPFEDIISKLQFVASMKPHNDLLLLKVFPLLLDPSQIVSHHLDSLSQLPESRSHIQISTHLPCFLPHTPHNKHSACPYLYKFAGTPTTV